MRKVLLHYIVICIALFSGADLRAQDSTKRTNEPATSPSVPTTVTPTVTTGEVITAPPKVRRRKKMTAADSARLIARRDSIQRSQAPVAATPPTNSAFDIGTTPVAPPAANLPTPATSATPAATPAQPPVPNLEQSGNPFDILRGGTNNRVDSTPNAAAIESAPTTAPSAGLLDKKTYSNNFLLWIFLATLIALAFVVANARSTIFSAYTTLVSASTLRQIHKDPVGWGSFPYFALYALFWVNVGILIYLSLPIFGVQPPFGQLTTFGLCVLGVTVFFLTKHAVLYILGNTFPILREAKAYNFILLNVGIILGLLLMPLNIFIAYAPSGVNSFFLYVALGVVVLLYGFKALRGLTVATPFLMENRFHFLLYLCTVEIAPLFLILKLVKGV